MAIDQANKQTVFGRYLMIGTILLCSMLTNMSVTVVAPSLPLMRLAFADAPEVLVKMILTVPALFITLSAPVCGVLLDQWGRKPVIMASIILYGLSGVSGYFFITLYGILAGRVLIGVAAAGIWTGFTTLIADHFTGSRLNQLMGLQPAVSGVGSIIFLTAAGFLADHHWRLPFLLYLFPFLLLPFAAFFITEPQKMTGRPIDPASQKPPAGMIKKVLPLYGVGFFGLMFASTISVQCPFFLRALGTMDSSRIGIALAIMVLFSALSAAQYHRQKDRFSFRQIFFMAFFAGAVGFYILSLSATYYHVLLALMVFGSGMGMGLPNANVFLVIAAPPQLRGRVLGGFTTSMFLGQFFAPLITEPAINSFDFKGGFMLFGIVMTIMALAFLFTRWKH